MILRWPNLYRLLTMEETIHSCLHFGSRLPLVTFALIHACCARGLPALPLPLPPSKLHRVTGIAADDRHQTLEIFGLLDSGHMIKVPGQSLGISEYKVEVPYITHTLFFQRISLWFTNISFTILPILTRDSLSLSISRMNLPPISVPSFT